MTSEKQIDWQQRRLMKLLGYHAGSLHQNVIYYYLTGRCDEKEIPQAVCGVMGMFKSMITHGL